MPDVPIYNPTPGVHLVATHLTPVEALEPLQAKITIQIDLANRHFRREYTVTAGDIIALAQAIANLLVSAAIAGNVRGGIGFSAQMKQDVDTAIGYVPPIELPPPAP